MNQAYETIDRLRKENRDLRAFIEACLDCKSANEAHDFLVNNVDSVLQGARLSEKYFRRS